MRVVVCVKPVPDPKQWSKVTLDPKTKTLRREGIGSVINPLDKNALTEAIRIAARSQGEVVVISMAPPFAADTLQEALAMGAQRAVLLSDRAFAGADSLATAYVVAAGIRKLGDCDLILCGSYSLDGSTAQVGPQVAEMLGIPHAVNATAIEIEGRILRARCQLEHGHAVLEMPLPALVTVVKELNTPRGVTMLGLVAARNKKVETWTAADLDVDQQRLGLAGSPTGIGDLFIPPVERRREVLHGTPAEAVDALLERLRGEGVLPG